MSNSSIPLSEKLRSKWQWVISWFVPVKLGRYMGEERIVNDETPAASDTQLGLTACYQTYDNLKLYLDSIERSGDRVLYVLYDPQTKKKIKVTKEVLNFLFYPVEKKAEVPSEG